MGEGQLRLDLGGHVDPITCPHRVEAGRFEMCTRDGRETYVACSTSHWGEPPTCSWEEPDNSPEAVARRLKWMKEHKEKRKDEHDADDH